MLKNISAVFYYHYVSSVCTASIIVRFQKWPGLYKERKKNNHHGLKRKENDLCGYDTAYTKENLKKKSQ